MHKLPMEVEEIDNCWAYEITLLRTAATSMHYWMRIFVRPKIASKRCCN